ncbi:MAG: transcriptional repressor [Candidatus Eisenbacteria bacterium]|uniref:Transcriptional repressor n=1 Tax=Eiseniibacteriota bacterium TaxID=2212470 RepID=A0A948S2S7_UNCEI|nr:transcriptional repressor [Candidatus Eisenbacteria bacterium]MBU1949944.1 transcriptional repressor [Candidatus Eisenbacteria bacterium]MBU2692764.1 transcriptional repressor [Candidatus Eisenbacteria bacterium]
MKLRRSRQREAILEALRSSRTHPTAVELYERVRRRLPKVSLGTVYRNLDLLARNGMIGRLDTGSGQARFDGETERHHHVRCVICGRVDDVHPSLVESMGGELKNLAGQEILGIRIEFAGLCSSCGAGVPEEKKSRLRREWLVTS